VTLLRWRRQAAQIALLFASAFPVLPAQEATGRLEASVVISSAVVARRARLRLYAEPGSGAPMTRAIRVDSADEMRNVVVYVTAKGAGAKLADLVPTSLRAPAAVRISQHDEVFVPHVLPILRGDTLAFPNDDDIYHNVFSLSSTRTFDLGRYPQGSSRSVDFPRAGRVDVFCHIHSDMSAVILVLENRFYATPDAKGRVLLEGLPPGEYEVVGFHQRVRPVVRTVRIEAGQTTRIAFPIPLPAPDAP
jgi:plastocyanin